jgi:hypothetical protein
MQKSGATPRHSGDENGSSNHRSFHEIRASFPSFGQLQPSLAQLFRTRRPKIKASLRGNLRMPNFHYLSHSGFIAFEESKNDDGSLPCIRQVLSSCLHLMPDSMITESNSARKRVSRRIASDAVSQGKPNHRNKPDTTVAVESGATNDGASRYGEVKAADFRFR